MRLHQQWLPVGLKEERRRADSAAARHSVLDAPAAGTQQIREAARLRAEEGAFLS